MGAKPGPMFSKYRIVERIGEGGMGVVFKALDTDLDREVAIKVLPSAAEADAARDRRFLREARTAAALNHPNICTIHEVGEIESGAGAPEAALGPGAPFLVMELIDGETLHARLERSGALALPEVLDLAV